VLARGADRQYGTEPVPNYVALGVQVQLLDLVPPGSGGLVCESVAHAEQNAIGIVALEMLQKHLDGPWKRLRDPVETPHGIDIDPNIRQVGQNRLFCQG
jgi:hypothetical protein